MIRLLLEKMELHRDPLIDRSLRSTDKRRAGTFRLGKSLALAAPAFLFWSSCVGVCNSAEDGSSRFNLPQIFNEIEQMEYEIKWQEHAQVLQCPNRAQNLRFSFPSASEIDVQRRSPTDPRDTWKIRLKAVSYGPQAPIAETAKEVSVEHNRASFHSGNLTVTYTNEVSGLHQCFLVATPPAKGSLSVSLAVLTDGAQAFYDETAGSVIFVRDDTGEEVMRYAGLHAFDATGTEMPSKLELKGQNIELSIDDSKAIYPVLIDPFYYSQFLPALAQAGAQVGAAVAFMETATNGNYYGSVAIGAPFFDDGLTDQGEVFVYLGSDNGLPNCTPGTAGCNIWRVRGDQANARFGSSLAVAQPYFFSGPSQTAINTFRDRYADLVVGEPYYNNGAGRVFVFYGTSSGMGPSFRSADRVYDSFGPAGGHFGISVAAGDVTGDGYQDLIVGMPDYEGGGVALYKGSSTGLPTTWTTVWESGNGGERAGFSVAFAGIGRGLMSSGTAEVLVGAPSYFSSKGEIYLLDWNGSTLVTGWNDVGDQAGGKLGYSVSGNANFDGTRINSAGTMAGQFMAAAPFYNDVAVGEGRVYVYRQDSTGTPPKIGTSSSPNILESPGHQANSEFGYSLCGGDFNKDLLDDVMIGAPFYSTNPNDQKGHVFVYYGSYASPPSNPDSFDSGLAMTGENFGSSVSYFFMNTSALDSAGVVGGAPNATEISRSAAGLAVLYTNRPFLFATIAANNAPSETIGMDYSPAYSQFIVSSGFSSGFSQFYEWISGNNTFSPLGNQFGQNGGEIHFAIASTSVNGFTSGQFMVPNYNYNATLMLLNPDATVKIAQWCILPSGEALNEGSSYFDAWFSDPSPLWVPSTGMPHLYKVNSSGTATLVMNVSAPAKLSCVSTVPNIASFGTLAGQVVAGDEQGNNLYYCNRLSQNVNPNGFPLAWSFPGDGTQTVSPETLVTMNYPKDFYVVSYGFGYSGLLKIPAAQWNGTANCVVLVTEFPQSVQTGANSYHYTHFWTVKYVGKLVLAPLIVLDSNGNDIQGNLEQCLVFPKYP